MTPSSDLFNLIKSLSVSEKRYFKIFSVTLSGNENSLYLKLFEALDQLETYEEATFVSLHNGAPFLSYLSSNKNYLFTALLRCLLQYSGEKSISIQSQFAVVAAEVLFQKGLFDSCLKLIAKGKEQNLLYENYTAYDQLCDWEARIHGRNNDFEKVEAIVEDQLLQLQKRVKISSFKKKAVHVFALLTEFENTQAPLLLLQIEQAIKFFLDQEPDKKWGANCLYFHYSAVGFYYDALKNSEQQLIYSQKVYDLFFEYPYFLETNERLYSSAINNLCSALINGGNFKEVIKQIKELKTILNLSNNAIKIEWRASSLVKILTTELLVLINQVQIQLAPALEQEITTFIFQNKKYVEALNLCELQFNLAHILFLNQEFTKALSLLEDILDNREAKKWVSFYLVSRVLVLLIYFELDEKKLLLNSIDTTQKFIKRKGLMEAENIQVVAFLKTIGNKELQKQELLKLKILVENKSSASLPHSLSNFINLSYWIRQK